MVRVKNFNEALEESLVKLGQEVEKQREVLKTEELPEREIVKSALKSFAVQTTPQSVGAAKEEEKKEIESEFLPHYVRKGDVKPDVEKEILNLVQIAFNKNLETAFTEAKKRSPFVQDAFHDVLAEKLLPELKKRKII